MASSIEGKIDFLVKHAESFTKFKEDIITAFGKHEQTLGKLVERQDATDEALAGIMARLRVLDGDQDCDGPPPAKAKKSQPFSSASTASSGGSSRTFLSSQDSSSAMTPPVRATIRPPRDALRMQFPFAYAREHLLQFSDALLTKMLPSDLKAGIEVYAANNARSAVLKCFTPEKAKKVYEALIPRSLEYKEQDDDEQNLEAKIRWDKSPEDRERGTRLAALWRIALPLLADAAGHDVRLGSDSSLERIFVHTGMRRIKVAGIIRSVGGLRVMGAKPHELQGAPDWLTAQLIQKVVEAAMTSPDFP